MHPRTEDKSQITDEKRSGMILDSYAKCLYFAAAAYEQVKNTLPLGADNHPGDHSKNKEKAFHAIERAEKILKSYKACSTSNEDLDHNERLLLNYKCLAEVHAKCKAGNCEAQAAIAFTHLWRCNVRPISFAIVGELDDIHAAHAFVIVGDINTPNTAMVCDPYHDEYYPLSQFNKRIAAGRFNKKITMIYTGDLSDKTDRIKEIFKCQIILPPDVNESINLFFSQYFMKAGNYGKVFWVDSPIYTKPFAIPTIEPLIKPTLELLPLGSVHENVYLGGKKLR